MLMDGASLENVLGVESEKSRIDVGWAAFQDRDRLSPRICSPDYLSERLEFERTPDVLYTGILRRDPSMSALTEGHTLLSARSDGLGTFLGHLPCAFIPGDGTAISSHNASATPAMMNYVRSRLSAAGFVRIHVGQSSVRTPSIDNTFISTSTIYWEAHVPRSPKQKPDE